MPTALETAIEAQRRRRSGPARHQPAEPPPFSFASLVRSQLRDPAIELQPGEGERERRACEALRAALPEAHRRRSGLPVPMAATSAPLLQNPAPSVVESVLRPTLVLERLGAQRAEVGPGLDGRAQIAPTTVSAGWSDPSTGEEHTSSEFSLGASNVRPRELSAHVSMPRRLLRGGQQVERLLRELLAEATGSEYERAAIAGSGKNGQPLGIARLHETGASGSTPMAGGTATYAEATAALQLAIDGGARLSRCGFLLPDSDFEQYAQTAGPQGQPMLLPGTDGTYLLAGRTAAFSPFLPAGYLIAGEFGQVRLTWQGDPWLLSNPYTQAHKGITKISIYDCFDVTVARPRLLHALIPA